MSSPSRLETLQRELELLNKCIKGKDAPQLIKGSWAKKLSGHLDTVVLHISEEAAEIKRESNGQEFKPTGPCLQQILQDGIITKISEVCLGEVNSNGRVVLLKTFAALLSTVHGNTLLLNEAIIRPLKLLIDNLALPTAALSDEEATLFTLLLNALCKRIADESTLLPLFFNPKHGIIADAFPIFNALVPLALRASESSLLARNAIIHCCELTRTHAALARWVTRDSSFCTQLSDTLLHMYTALPTTLPDGGKFWKLALSETKSLRGVKPFLDLLEFCNDIVPVSAPTLASRIITLVEERLLTGALAGHFKATEPANTCVAATIYLDLALRHLTTPAVVQPFVRPFVQFAIQNRALLIERIHARGDTCLVTLRFLQTLVSLNCEDVMLELCLKPLLSREHLVEPSTPPTPHPEDQPEIAAMKQAFAQVQAAVGAAGPRAFLALAPLGGAAAASEGIAAYISDAQRTVHECRVACAGWTHEYTGADCDQAETRPSNGLSGEGFYRATGLFFRNSPQRRSLNARSATEGLIPALLKRLSNTLANPTPVTLLLTAVLARIAAYPQPLLRAYLLDPLLPLRPEIPSLYRTLEVLSRTAREELRRTHGLTEAIAEYRDKINAGSGGSAGGTAAATPVPAETAGAAPATSESTSGRAGGQAAASPSSSLPMGSPPASSSSAATAAAATDSKPNFMKKLFARSRSDAPRPSSDSAAPSSSPTPAAALASKKPATGDPFSDALTQAQQQAPEAAIAQRTIIAFVLIEEFLLELTALALEQNLRALSEAAAS